ncbi:hypothetical protein BX600DRAFT_71383 [Xylariales sp. PMI_506]|nr:hypothetical protein BX600DRAFT_71383 [Xylariales sp. PMI_506]
MALDHLSVDVVLQALEDDGYYDLQDAAAGEHVLDMERRSFPWHDLYAVDWMKIVVLNPVSTYDIHTKFLSNYVERVRRILEKSFNKFFETRNVENPPPKRCCILAHSYKYTAAPGHYYRFLPSDKFCIGVFLWSKGSEVNYFKNTHLKSLPTLNQSKDPTQPTEPLLEIPEHAVEGFSREPLDFSSGGMVIANASTVIEIRRGYFIVDLFFPDGQLPKGKMEVPWSKEMEMKVDELQSETIKVNFTYIGKTGEANG